MALAPHHAHELHLNGPIGPRYADRLAALDSRSAGRRPREGCERVVDTGQHIVVVDDESDIVDILAQVLREDGYDVLPFTQADRALQSMLASRPALLITDLVMPVLSGQELIARVRAAHGPMVPTLVMSASLHIAAVAGLPVQAFLSKPFDLDDFCATVQALLQPAYVASVRVEAPCSST